MAIGRRAAGDDIVARTGALRAPAKAAESSIGWHRSVSTVGLERVSDESTGGVSEQEHDNTGDIHSLAPWKKRSESSELLDVHVGEGRGFLTFLARPSKKGGKTGVN